MGVGDAAAEGVDGGAGDSGVAVAGDDERGAAQPRQRAPDIEAQRRPRGGRVGRLGVAAQTGHGQVVQISTRGRVGTGDEVMIGGFIIQGSTTKTVLILAIGPSLGANGVAGPLADPTLELRDEGLNPEQTLGKSEVANVVHQEIDRIPPLLRKVFLLRDVQRLSMHDVAAQLGISIAAAKSRLLRARIELRTRMSKHQSTLGAASLMTS